MTWQLILVPVVAPYFDLYIGTATSPLISTSGIVELGFRVIQNFRPVSILMSWLPVFGSRQPSFHHAREASRNYRLFLTNHRLMMVRHAGRQCGGLPIQTVGEFVFHELQLRVGGLGLTWNMCRVATSLSALGLARYMPMYLC